LNPTKDDNKTKKQRSTIALVIAATLALSCSAAFYVFYQSDEFEDTYQFIRSKLGLKDSPLPQTIMTYYQWVDEQGKLAITLKKPPSGVQFFSFKGSADLLTNENNLNYALIAKSEAFKASLSDARIEGEEALGETTADNSKLSALRKAKHCLELSVQVAQSNREFKDDDDSKLMRKQHKADCIDNFPVK
jgi:hypothetical protein